jgi:GntR family transcriptional regulator
MDVWMNRVEAVPTPKYWNVRQAVEELIRANRLRPGDRLPTEPELVERLAVSRGTVRRAFDDLEREGIVSRQPGRGTFVAERRMMRPLSELTSFTEHLQSLGLAPGARLVSWRDAESDDGEGHFAAGIPLVRIVRVRTANDEPVGVHTLYLDASLASRVGFTRDRLKRSPETSLYATFAASGVQIDIAREDLTARVATARERGLLGLPSHAAVLEVVRRSFTAADEPVELVRAVYRADRYDYVIWLRRESGRFVPDMQMRRGSQLQRAEEGT